MTAADSSAPDLGAAQSGGVAALRRGAGSLLTSARQTRDTLGLRLGLGVLAVLVAYHFSLLTLLRDLQLDSPLAYLGLVPLIAAGIAVVLPRAGRVGPDIHDRQLDYIVGLPLVIGATAAVHVLPGRLSTLFWTNRVDLLTLPVFVFGVSVLLFGVRETWRFRVPIAFLFLAWPVPYAWAVEHTLDLTTGTTITAVKWCLSLVSVASPQPGGDGSVFVVHHGVNGFPVSTASACAGVNSLVGFIVVGCAFLALVRGKPRADGTARRLLGRKVVWLMLGMLVVWMLNVARIMLVLYIGRFWGETVAIDGFHPFIGMVTFSIGVLLLLLVMPWFGLRLVGDGLEARPATGERALRRAQQVLGAAPVGARGWRFSMASVAACAAVIGIANSSFSHFELVAGDLGSPKLVSFQQAPTQVSGWSLSSYASYDWIRRYFGNDSSWQRFLYSANSGAGQPVFADVIDGSKLGPFNSYGVEACYSFHGYSTTKQNDVDLGAGIVGHTLAYRDPRQTVQYNVMYWVWPVTTTDGKRYERVTLLQASDGGLDAANPESNPLRGVGYSAPSGNADKALTLPAAEEDGLVALGKQIVSHEEPAASTKVPVVQHSTPAGTSPTAPATPDSRADETGTGGFTS